MAKNLTTNQKAEIAKNSLKTRILVTLDLKSGPFRILENDTVTNFVLNGNTYYTRLVAMSDIETTLDGNGEKLSLSISDICQEISGLIANTGDSLTNIGCKVEEVIFSGDSSNVIDSPILLFDGLIDNVELSATNFSFDVERPLFSYSTISPNMTYDINCQFKFKDNNCKYNGSETKCDKTIARCQALSNVTRFGGFPSVISQVNTK